MDAHPDPSASPPAQPKDPSSPVTALEWLSELVSASKHEGDRAAWAIAAARSLNLTEVCLEQARGQDVGAVFRHGPAHSGGIALTFDLATIPIPRNDWTTQPEDLTHKDGSLVGRGVTGAGAMLAAALGQISEGWAPRIHPIWLIVFDSTRCAPSALTEALDGTGLRPRLILSAQPTGLAPVNAHPGCARYRTHVFGSRGQAVPPWAGVNAAETMVRYAAHMAELRSALMLRPGQATLAVEHIQSTPGQGAMPHRASLDWVMSYWKSSDLGFALDSLDQFAKDNLEPQMQALDPTAGIALERVTELPPLRAAPQAEEALAMLFKRPAQPMQIFGWGGAWQVLGAPVAGFGPGDPNAAYRPNEAIRRRDLAACRALFTRIDRVLSP